MNCYEATKIYSNATNCAHDANLDVSIVLQWHLSSNAMHSEHKDLN